MDNGKGIYQLVTRDGKVVFCHTKSLILSCGFFGFTSYLSNNVFFFPLKNGSLSKLKKLVSYMLPFILKDPNFWIGIWGNSSKIRATKSRDFHGFNSVG